MGIGQRVEAVVAGGGGLVEAVHVFVFAVVVEAGAEFQRMLVQNLGDVAEPIMVPVVVVVGSEADNALPIIEANAWNAGREAERKSRLDMRRLCRGHRSGWSADYGAVGKRVTQVGKKRRADGPGPVDCQVSARRVCGRSCNAGNTQTGEQPGRLLGWDRVVQEAAKDAEFRIEVVIDADTLFA